MRSAIGLEAMVVRRVVLEVAVALHTHQTFLLCIEYVQHIPYPTFSALHLLPLSRFLLPLLRLSFHILRLAYPPARTGSLCNYFYVTAYISRL